MKEALRCFGKNYGNFEGRASRKEYVCFYVWMFLFMMALAIVLTTLGLKETHRESIFGLFSLYAFIPSISLIVRRFHDLGKNGWSYFLLFIPIVGFIFALLLIFKKGEAGENRYGVNPIELQRGIA